MVEASIALHLAKVLGQEMDLNASRLYLQYSDDFEIEIVASDTPDSKIREHCNVAQATKQMTVLPLNRNDVMRHFANEDVDMYAFVSWIPTGNCWREDMERDARDLLAEICYLSCPPSLIKVDSCELHSQNFATAELFPKTLCRFDFWPYTGPSSSDDYAKDAGLHHSQLFVFHHPRAVPPFLSSVICHNRGSYAAHMTSDPKLEAVNVWRGVGLGHAHGPDDLAAPIPESILGQMQLSKEARSQMRSQGDTSVLARLREAFSYAEGTARAQLCIALGMR